MPSTTFSAEGIPYGVTSWAKDGILQCLPCDKYWSKIKRVKTVAVPASVIMAGTNESVASIIASCERAILVYHFWYIRVVDPKTLLLTGLTRDGTFLVENGQIKHPIKNFRFNESPPNMLKHVEKIGQTMRTLSNETEDRKFAVPPLQLSKFRFSSVSDAV